MMPNHPVHWLKVIFLLVLTLAVMRLASWTLGWLAFRLAKVPHRLSTWIGNLAALSLFVGFVVWNLAPGEPFDVEATVFGVVVYAIFQAVDLKWCLWGARQSAREG